MKERIFTLFCLVCAMVWSGNVWATDYTTTISGSNLQSLLNGGYKDGRLTFTVNSDLSYSSSSLKRTSEATTFSTQTNHLYISSVGYNYSLSNVTVKGNKASGFGASIVSMTLQVGSGSSVTLGTSETTASCTSFSSQTDVEVKVHSSAARNYYINSFTISYSASPITYNVAYDANGGAGTMASTTMTYDQAANLSTNTFTRKGYAFGGWASSAGGTAVYGNSQSVKNLTATDGATITLYAVWVPKTLSLDEQTTSYSAGDYHTATVTRTLKAGQFSTLCLPFDYTLDGDVYTFTGDENVGGYYHLFFEKQADSKLVAGIPYIVVPNSDITAITANDVDIISGNTSNGTVSGTAYDFVGNLATSSLKTGDIYVSTTDGSFKAMTAADTNLKAFRAVLRPVEAGSKRSFDVSLGETITGIITVDGDLITNDAPIYNLKGQRVNNPTQPGIYIQNGRKFTIL